MIRLPYPRCLRALCEPVRERRGVAALEFAVIAGVMITLVFIAYDIGNAALQFMQLSAGVRAGGEYAVSFPTDAGGISAAVTTALPNYLRTATIANACECGNGSGGASSDPCDISATVASCDLCPSGTTQRFVHVTANMSYAWFATPLPITATTAGTACYVARVQ